ncbi:acyl-ACP desaturase [Pseudoroseomonas ludipueritiae]|uniref:Ferritin-like domain-containing protein n=1 Tax=Pseudoroseomonas ludipueritiae TaxID=198093 RepID=A0ABR7R473_9PROT|nr:ferritin-like domain-containing protein [Pseudoroseomonas ludipueritiae]MBC9176487.1 ferritin-like domain-containing protein [Pseudoroseomonas ludipueritiae]
MKHWHIEQVAWDRFDPSKIDPGIIPLVKAAAMVEKNGVDYAKYLNGVFVDDPDFRQAADNWAVEEVQHGDALGKWAMLADPTWNFDESFERYRNGYKIDINADASIRGSRTGELIARCMVEIGTSSYYTALGENTEEPVLKEVCKLIAADEYRHFKLFYDHMKRYLAREKLSFLQRLRVAAGRVGESEDDELAFAFHCGNDPVGTPYDHNRCIAGYMSRAMGYYRYHHIERGMGMMFKAIGLQPRGRLSSIATKGAWRLLCWRRDKFQRETGVANENAQRPQQAAA